MGETRTLDREVFTDDGTSQNLSLTFTRTAGGWDVAGSLGGANAAGTLDGGLTVGGVAVDLTAVTTFAGVDSASISSQNGSAAGVLQSYTMGPDGTLTGRFSNGASIDIAQIVLGQVDNPRGCRRSETPATP